MGMHVCVCVCVGQRNDMKEIDMQKRIIEKKKTNAYSRHFDVALTAIHFLLDIFLFRCTFYICRTEYLVLWPRLTVSVI